MTQPFDSTETGFTATAMNLAPASPGPTTLNFSVWPNPDRAKINAALATTNQYQHRRRGVW